MYAVNISLLYRLKFRININWIFFLSSILQIKILPYICTTLHHTNKVVFLNIKMKESHLIIQE